MKRSKGDMKRMHVKLKKKKFIKVYFFNARYRSKKKVLDEYFKIYAFNYMSAKKRVNRYFQFRMKRHKLLDVFQISKDKIGKKDPIEISMIKKKIFKKKIIDFNRLQKFKHKGFGDIWITDPELIVTKDVIGEGVLFYVPIDNNRVEVKTIVFDPKYFLLDYDQKNQVLRGRDQRTKSRFISIEEKLQLLHIYSERSIKIDLSIVEEALNKLLVTSSEEFKVLVREAANRMVQEIMKMKKIRIKGEFKYSLIQCIKHCFRKNPEYQFEDLELACKILRKKGYAVPKAVNLF